MIEGRAVRVLGIETSTRRGSVALVEDGRLVAHRAHEQPNAHAERLLPLVTELMRESGWSPGGLDRVAVSIGPGSFTGVRVGMALAQGIALGLAVPVVGVPSLTAMASAVPARIPGRRLACLDARRDAVFVAVHPTPGPAAPEPCVVPRSRFSALLAELAPIGPLVVVGEIASELGVEPLPSGSDPEPVRERGAGPVRYVASDADLPDARWVAVLGLDAEPAPLGPAPLYVREPDALLPMEPPDALARRLALGPFPAAPGVPPSPGGV